jgi:hypothetical protein
MTDTAAARFCVNDRRCTNGFDNHGDEVKTNNTLCLRCLRRSRKNIEKFPEQWGYLQAIIGEKNAAGIDVGIRQKPSGSVLLNVSVEALLGRITDTLTIAAEVIADRLAMENPDHPDRTAQILAWRPTRHAAPAATQIQTCAWIVAPHLEALMCISGVGGREPQDPAIDVMFWNTAGSLHGVKCTTGLQLIAELDHLSGIAHFTLGQTRARYQRDIPCSRCHAKTVGRWAGSEHFDCTACGSRFPENDIRRQDRILLELHRRGVLSVD